MQAVANMFDPRIPRKARNSDGAKRFEDYQKATYPTERLWQADKKHGD